jgi:hypothetical protein
MLDNRHPLDQPSGMSLEKRYLRVETLLGDRVFGSFVIGVPIATVLDLKNNNIQTTVSRVQTQKWTMLLGKALQRRKNVKFASI